MVLIPYRNIACAHTAVKQINLVYNVVNGGS